MAFHSFYHENNEFSPINISSRHNKYIETNDKNLINKYSSR